MKKMTLTLAAIGIFFAAGVQAQETVPVKGEVKTEVMATNFEKIEVSELPEAVTNAVNADFPKSIISEAFVKENEELEGSVYKLKLNVDGVDKVVFADANGNWVKDEE